MSQYRYNVTPYLSAPTSVTAMMCDVIVALLPALGMAMFLFGPSVLLTAMASMGFCVTFQWLYCLVFHRQKRFLDPSPWVTGLLLALCYPSDISFLGICVGSFVSVVLVKELYGGLGCNFLNPALVGRATVTFFPLMMTTFSTPLPLLTANVTDAMSGATPMVYLHDGVLPPVPLYELFIGFHAGSIGEVSTLMLLLGGIYLLARRVITWTIPVSILGTVALLTFCFPPDHVSSLSWMVAQLCSGGLMLGAFFMATDPVSSPSSQIGQCLFGVGCGLLTLLLRYFGSYPEGVCFAILTMNGLVWLIDRVAIPRRFGAKHFALTRNLFGISQHKLSQVEWIKPKIPNLKELSFPKHLIAHPAGTVPGERYLDRLHTNTKAVLCYGGILVGTVAAVTIVSNLTNLQTYRSGEEYQETLLAQAMPEASFMSISPYHREDFTHLYLAYQGHEHIGYCIAVTTPGFGGPISLLVGISNDGEVTGVAVLDHNETTQRGTNALTEEALQRFVGRSGKLSLSGNNKIDAISGATTTLDAITEGVNTALLVAQLIDQAGALGQLEDDLQ